MAKDCPNLSALMDARDAARDQFFSHRDPGNLTPAQKSAYRYTNMALLLLLKAAQIELESELEFHALKAAEMTQ